MGVAVPVGVGVSVGAGVGVAVGVSVASSAARRTSKSFIRSDRGGNELDHCLHFLGQAFEGEGCVLCIERGADSDQENNDKEREKEFLHCSSLPFSPLG